MMDSQQAPCARMAHPFASPPAEQARSISRGGLNEGLTRSPLRSGFAGHPQNNPDQQFAAGSSTLHPHHDAMRDGSSAGNASVTPSLGDHRIASGAGPSSSRHPTVPHKASSMSHGPVPNVHLPLDADAIVQAAHPDHPDHHLWLERFGSTASRRRAPSINNNAAAASTSASTGTVSNRNSVHTMRSGSAMTGQSSSEGSSDDGLSPSASPMTRQRRRNTGANSPEAQRTRRRNPADPANGGSARRSASPTASGSQTRKKRRDKGKIKAPPPPLPPPRVSSSVAMRPPEESAAPGLDFPSLVTVPVSPMSLSGAMNKVFDSTEPMENMQSYSGRGEQQQEQQYQEPPLRLGASRFAHPSSSTTAETPTSSQFPRSQKLSTGTSSSNQGSSSYDTAAQYFSRPSSGLSYQKHPSQIGTPVRSNFSPPSGQGAPQPPPPAPRDVWDRAAQPPTDPTIGVRARAGSFDLLRETLSFGATKSSKKSDAVGDSSFAGSFASSKEEPSSARTGSASTRIRASLDAVRPKMFTMPRKTSEGSRSRVDDDDDSLEWMAEDTASSVKKRSRLASIISSLRSGQNRGGTTTLPRASSDLNRGTLNQQSSTSTFVPRGSRSMDIPRRPVPRLEDLSAAPKVPQIPASYAVSPSATNTTLQAPSQPLRGRLSLVGEEPEEGSDYCDAPANLSNGDESDPSGQQDGVEKAEKSRAKLEKMLGEAFPHVPGGALRSATPPPAPALAPAPPSEAPPHPPPEERPDLPGPIYVGQQQPAHHATTTAQEHFTTGPRFPSHIKGHQTGANTFVSVSSFRSHDTSYIRSSSGPSTIADTMSNSQWNKADTVGTQDSNWRQGAIASLFNRSKRPKNRSASGSTHDVSALAHDAPLVSSHGQHSNSMSSSASMRSLTAVAGLGIAPVRTISRESPFPTTTYGATQAGTDAATDPQRRRAKSGTWRNRVSSISSVKSLRKGGGAGSDKTLPPPPPVPSLPVSQSEPADMYARTEGRDEGWRRNLLAEAVNLSLLNSPEIEKQQAGDGRKAFLSVDDKEDPDATAKSAKRSPFLEVVAAGRKSFSRDRGRPSKGEVDALQQPGLPTIHKSLSPALLSETVPESSVGHGRNDSVATSQISSAVDEPEPWDGLDDDEQTSSSRLQGPIEVVPEGQRHHGEKVRPLNIVKQSSASAANHSRNASLQSHTSGGSGSSGRFRVHRVPVPTNLSTESPLKAGGGGDGDGSIDGSEERDRLVNMQGGSTLDVSTGQSSQSAAASPVSPASPNGSSQTGSFSGKRAFLGKHSTPPNLRLSPSGQEMLSTPPQIDRSGGSDHQWMSPSSWKDGPGKFSTPPPVSPNPSLGSLQSGGGGWRGGLSKSPRLPPSLSSNGPFSAGPGRTSFSTDRDRAPVASPYHNHNSGSNSSPRVANLRGAFRKFTSSAVSPNLRTYSPSSKAISSDSRSGGIVGTSDYASWDDSLAAAQEATKMLQAHTETLLPSPGWTPLTQSHSRPETASLNGSTTSGGGHSGRFAAFHNGNDSSSGSGTEDREVLSNAFNPAANKSTTSLGAGVGNGFSGAAGGGSSPGNVGGGGGGGGFPRPEMAMTFRERARSTTAPVVGHRSASSSSLRGGTAVSASSSQQSNSSELQAFDAMLRAQKNKEDAMLKSISERSRTPAQTIA